MDMARDITTPKTPRDVTVAETTLSLSFPPLSNSPFWKEPTALLVRPDVPIWKSALKRVPGKAFSLLRCCFLGFRHLVVGILEFRGTHRF